MIWSITAQICSTQRAGFWYDLRQPLRKSLERESGRWENESKHEDRQGTVYHFSEGVVGTAIVMH